MLIIIRKHFCWSVESLPLNACDQILHKNNFSEKLFILAHEFGGCNTVNGLMCLSRERAVHIKVDQEAKPTNQEV